MFLIWTDYCHQMSVNSSFVSVDDDVSCISELSSSSSHFFSNNSTVSSGASSTEPLSAGVFLLLNHLCTVQPKTQLDMQMIMEN